MSSLIEVVTEIIARHTYGPGDGPRNAATHVIEVVQSATLDRADAAIRSMSFEYDSQGSRYVVSREDALDEIRDLRP